MQILCLLLCFKSVELYRETCGGVLFSRTTTGGLLLHSLRKTGKPIKESWSFLASAKLEFGDERTIKERRNRYCSTLDFGASSLNTNLHL